MIVKRTTSYTCSCGYEFGHEKDIKCHICGAPLKEGMEHIKTNNVYSVSLEVKKFCCRKMKESIVERFIFVQNPNGVRGGISEVSLCTWNYDFYALKPIECCPFCKEEIEYVEEDE